MSEPDMVLQLAELLRVAITPPHQPRERLWISATCFLAGMVAYHGLRVGGWVK